MEEILKKTHSRVWKGMLSAAIILLLLLIAVWYVLFQMNEFTLSIQLTGEETVTLEYGSDYEEPGATATFQGTLFQKEGIVPEGLQLQIIGEVDETALGRYTIRYCADYHWWHAEARRTVQIIDTQCPVITLTEDSQESLVPGTIYQEAGFHAADNYDGDITERVTRTETMGQITYAVTDSSGNPAVAVREIPHHDPIAPVITLVGGENYTIRTGTKYQEPGYSAEDNVDGDLTGSVTVEGEVDWLTPGVYPVSYTVSDAYENITTVVRNVEVEAKEWPDTVYPEEKTIYLTFDDGPGPHTEQLLDILDKYQVKATFFVIDTGEYDLMKEIVYRGHSIGIHSVSHNYEEIYASPEAFFEDLYGMQKIIYEHTGVETTLMRFPGGSSNEISRRISKGIMTTLTEAVQNAGFQYFDWNVLSGDAGDTTKTREVYNYVINAVSQVDVAVVLQHDIHEYSVAAVEDIILWGLNNGYQFLPLRSDSPGFHQYVAN